MAETEAILLKRFVRNGDAEAFGEIIRRHAGLVYSAALRVLADVDRASDIAQDTFLQLAKDAGNVTGSLPGWLHRVATHKAIDQIRRDATRRHREAHYVVPEPQETADWREISPYVDEGLNLLDPQLRNVLIAHFLEGRSTREIARTQGLSQATISRRIDAGVEQLRAGLRRRGVLVAAGTLGVLLGENAVQAAPQVLLTELGKIALISGSLTTCTTAAGTASEIGTIAASVVSAVKANAVAVAAVAVICAGTLVTHQQITNPPSRLRATHPSTANSTALRPDGFASAPLLDPTGQTHGPGGRLSPNPMVQALPGPEAETDPREYYASLGVGGAHLLDLIVPEEDMPDLPQHEEWSSSVAAEPDTTEAVPDAPHPAAGQTRESPYEMVERLRREAVAGRREFSSRFDQQIGDSTGSAVARAELKLVRPIHGSPGGMLRVQRQDTTTVRPAGIWETPPDAPADPVYFVVRTGDREIQGITYRSISPPENVMLYLDTKGDGRWSNEKTYVGRRLSAAPTYEFGPVYLTPDSTAPGGDVLYVQCFAGRSLAFWSAFHRVGEVFLGGRTYRIALIDANLSGRFNDFQGPSAGNGRDAGYDMLAIDLDGDGRFTGMQLYERTIVPLDRRITIGGRHYHIDVAEDGSWIEFRRAEPSFGFSRPDAIPGGTTN